MKIKVEMAGGKGRVFVDVELEPENFYLDRMNLIFDKALEAYKGLEEAEMDWDKYCIAKGGNHA